MSTKTIPITDQAELPPFEIWEVMLDNATIRFFKPFYVQPVILRPEEPRDPTYWTADVPELDISAVGVSLEELSSCIRSDIRMTWNEIVRRHDSELTPNTRIIKKRWLKIAEECTDG